MGRLYRIQPLGADGGNVAIEFAFVLPILVLMTLGAVDFGMAYSMQTSYEGAARAGFEYAFKNTDDLAGIKQRVSANIDSANLDSGYPMVVETCGCTNGSAVACSGTCGTADPIHYIEITVQGSYRPLFDWPFIDQNQPISHTARMRVE